MPREDVSTVVLTNKVDACLWQESADIDRLRSLWTTVLRPCRKSLCNLSRTIRTRLCEWWLQ